MTAQLLSALRDEAHCLQALLQQLRRQQQALIQGDTGQIAESSQQAEHWLQQLAAAGQTRAALQGESSLGDAEAGGADLREKTQFRVLLQTLRQGAAELPLLQARNRALIDAGLNWVDATLSSFVQLQQNGQPVVYGASGTEAGDWAPERSMCDFNA